MRILPATGLAALLAAVPMLALCDPAARTPEQVITHHYAAAAALDLDGMLNDYADDVVFITPDGMWRGKAALRKKISENIALQRVSARVPHIKLERFTPNFVWVMWVRNEGKPNEQRGVQTFLLHDGRIEVEAVAAVAVHPAPAPCTKANP